mmetsp:Transcript_69869/g.138261  ORF Transcript_69869/g.138261 Transcript_69869/m.138261 type:complete len:81 (+) Transcript_69869:121-363(+)
MFDFGVRRSADAKAPTGWSAAAGTVRAAHANPVQLPADEAGADKQEVATAKLPFMVEHVQLQPTKPIGVAYARVVNRPHN